MPRKSTKSASGESRLKQLRQASSLLKLISDPNRLLILLMLADGELSGISICEALNVSYPAVKYHLAMLRFGGGVLSQRQGTQVFYGLTEIGEVLARVAKVLTG